jgi:hypothetical protein
MVICHDQKDFDKEIKNIRYDLMLNEYPKEFFNSIKEPSRSNRHSSEATCQGVVIITYVKGSFNCLCDPVVRVPGYRSRNPGSIPNATRFSEK